MPTRDVAIIDCHIHPLAGTGTGTNWFGDVGDAKAQFETLKRAGISRACGAPVLPGTPPSFQAIRALNDHALALRDRFPDFYIPGIQVHPHFPEESCREIERCCGGEGVRWIGELVGYMMGFADEYATSDALEIMRSARDHKAVVNFHCYDTKVIDRLCKAVPDLKLVLAHPGHGREEILARLAKVAQHPNLHLDIAGSGIDRFGVIRCAMDHAGKEKILFGTDFPINNPAVYVHGVQFEPLSKPELSALFEKNFLRLHGRG
jgi:predicted TIM-barrel fold metal-dependent hydrolase